MAESQSSKDSKGSDKNQWQLQIEGGRLAGPFTTKQMLERISSGDLTGEEKIRQYPNGPWIELSREPVFYDKILDALDQSVMKSSQKKQPLLTDEDETRIMQISSSKPTEEDIDSDRTQIRKPTTHGAAKSEDAGVPSQNEEPQSEPPSNDVAPFDEVPEGFNSDSVSGKVPVVTGFSGIQRATITASVPEKNTPVIFEKPQKINEEKPAPEPTTQQVEKIKKKSSAFPLLLIFLCLFGLGGAYIFMFEPKLLAVIASMVGIERKPRAPVAKGDGIRLIAPKNNVKTTLSAKDLQQKISKVSSELNEDTVDSFVDMQKKLVEIIEGAPEDKESKGLLCYVQLQLWPFVKQSSEDLSVAFAVKKTANNYDDINKFLCDVTYLMMTGRYNEASGVIQEVGNRGEIKQSPILSSLRAEILAAKHNYKEATVWALSAAEDWTFWTRPKFQAALYSKESADIEKAKKLLIEILEKNPTHKLSLIELGALLYEQKIDVVTAGKYLVAAEQNKARVFREQEAKMYSNLAMSFRDSQNKAKALEYAQKAFQLNPADLKFRELVVELGGTPANLLKGAKNNELIFLGDQFFRAGDYLAAQAEYKSAFEIDPTSAVAAEKAAKSLWLLYQKQEAIAWLEKAVSADPKMGSSYYLLTDYHLQMFNFQAATEAVTRGGKQNSASADYQKAAALFEYRSQNYQASANRLEQGKKKYESDIEIMILMAKAYLAMGTEKDLESAKSAILRAVILDDLNVEAQVVWGKMLAKTSLDAAVEHFNSKIKKFSETPAFRIGLAEAYRSAENIKKAQEVYESILSQYDKNKLALLGLADCYYDQEQWVPALKNYLSAAIIDPLDPEPIFKSGKVYMEVKKFKEAKAQFERGLNVLKAYPKGNYLFGKAALAMKEYPVALKAAADERKLYPNLVESYILAGEVYTETQDFKKCALELQEAIRILPKGTNNYIKLAQCLAWSDSLEAAESMITIATSQDSGIADIYKVQGYIFEKQGQSQEAAQAYEKYITMAPMAVDKKLIEDRIKQLER